MKHVEAHPLDLRLNEVVPASSLLTKPSATYYGGGCHNYDIASLIE